MDESDRELTNRLFATATAMLEDAIDLTVAGQSAKAEPAELTQLGRQLQAMAQEVAIIAESTAILAEFEIRQRRRESSDQR